jgi:hypothetical protein
VESCDYFAYDKTDKDCYVFEGCANEVGLYWSLLIA